VMARQPSKQARRIPSLAAIGVIASTLVSRSASRSQATSPLRPSGRVRTAEALKQTLLQAKSIGFTGVGVSRAVDR
jgi:hypothetical protein